MEEKDQIDISLSERVHLGFIGIPSVVSILLQRFDTKPEERQERVDSMDVSESYRQDERKYETRQICEELPVAEAYKTQ